MERLRQRHQAHNENTCVHCGEAVVLDNMRWVHCEQDADEACDDPNPGI